MKEHKRCLQKQKQKNKTKSNKEHIALNLTSALRLKCMWREGLGQQSVLGMMPYQDWLMT